MSPLAQQMSERLPWLFRDLGFRMVADSYDPKVFGDCVVSLESDVLKLRFVRERGKIFAELASLSAPEWWDLAIVLQAIQIDQEPRVDLEAVGASIRDHFPALTQALGPQYPQTKQEIERQLEKRRPALQPSAKPGLRKRIQETAAGRLLIHVMGWALIGFVVWMIASRK
jgi:hypothetical protein